jgi:hypothetical protein
MINIFKNLTSYNPGGLIGTVISGRRYLTNPICEPAYSIVLAFGNEETFASKSLVITAKDSRIFFDYNLPLIGQYAVMKNMSEIRKNDWTIDTMTKGELTKDVPKNSRECLEIAREIVISDYGRGALENGLFIAHPAHMERVLGLAKKLDFKGNPFVESVPVWNVGQEKLGAGATVSAEDWKKYEIKARLHHTLKGWI